MFDSTRLDNFPRVPRRRDGAVEDDTMRSMSSNERPINTSKAEATRRFVAELNKAIDTLRTNCKQICDTLKVAEPTLSGWRVRFHLLEGCRAWEC